MMSRGRAIKTKYAAMQTSDGLWAVHRCRIIDWVPVGTIQTFGTFEEANDVARKVASGDYPDLAPAGEFVSMR
jgi:hypothetical protein